MIMATGPHAEDTSPSSTSNYHPQAGGGAGSALPAGQRTVVVGSSAHVDLPASNTRPMMSGHQSGALHCWEGADSLTDSSVASITPAIRFAPPVSLPTTTAAHQAIDDLSTQRLDQQAHARTHHLLKHQLPDGDMSIHFGTEDLKTIVKIINKMGQRDLQAKFKDVFKTPTFSNNNNWLRRKLMEAVGLQAPKVQGKAKNGGRRGSAAKKKTTKTSEGGGDSPPRTPKRKRSAAAPTAIESPASQKRRSARRAYLIQEDQLIWAKMKGQGYWPAQVVNPVNTSIADAQPSADSILVRYLENSYGWVPQAEVLDLMQNWDRLSTSRSSPAFLAALSRAENMLKMKHIQAGGTELTDHAASLPMLVTNMRAEPRPWHEGGESDSATASHHSPLLPPVADPIDDLLTPNHLSHLCESQLLHETSFGLDAMWTNDDAGSLADSFLDVDPRSSACSQDLFINGLPLISPFL